MRLVFLWTDALIFLLVATVIAGVIYARGKEHLRAPWRLVARSKMGMASLVVLFAYVAIGLLDCVHFRYALPDKDASGEVVYAGEVLSVLDVIARPLKEGVERTYSAPFATHAFAKETVELPDGGQQRVFPRLVYGGVHLQNPDTERGGDIFQRSLIAIFMGLLISLILASAIAALIAHRHSQTTVVVLKRIWRRQLEVPWRVILGTASVVIVIMTWCVVLSAKYHVLGTDMVGQDVFYQALKSIRTGLAIGTLTTLVMLPFAVMLGITAGYLKGWVDDVVQYLYTTLNSIPGVLLIAASVLMLQVYMANNPDMFDTDAARADIRLVFLCIILGITSWTSLCRMLRGEAMKLREVDYIEAAVAFGVSKFKIMTRHLLPNVMHIVMISVVLDFSGLVLAEAVLSYVGVGVDPTMNSWGNMINGARLEMAREPMVWWSLTAAFIFMFILVLAANLFSDAVRDAFDPRLRK
jgi:peptide/nickel transport system permease protein